MDPDHQLVYSKSCLMGTSIWTRCESWKNKSPRSQQQCPGQFSRRWFLSFTSQFRERKAKFRDYESEGFPDSSAGKESACDAGDPSLIPGSGRSTGEGIGYPLQYPWASIVAQLVKNLPITWETWVQSLGLEDPLKKGKAMLSSILAWRIPWTS